MSIQQLPGNTDPNVNPDGTGGHYNVVQTGKMDSAGVFHPDGSIQNITLLPSATRTTNTVSATIQNTGGYRGLIIYLNITAASGTGGLAPQLVAVDGLSGGSNNYGSIGTVKTTTGCWIYTIYPVASIAAGNGGTLVFPLPANYQIRISHGDATNYTYSVTADLIP